MRCTDRPEGPSHDRPEYQSHGLRDGEVRPQPGAQLPQSPPVTGVQLLSEIGIQNLIDLNGNLCHCKLQRYILNITFSRTDEVWIFRPTMFASCNQSAEERLKKICRYYHFNFGNISRNPSIQSSENFPTLNNQNNHYKSLKTFQISTVSQVLKCNWSVGNVDGRVFGSY